MTNAATLLLLSFVTLAGVQYRVQHSADLATWQTSLLLPPMRGPVTVEARSYADVGFLRVLTNAAPSSAPTMQDPKTALRVTPPARPLVVMDTNAPTL